MRKEFYPLLVLSIIAFCLPEFSFSQGPSFNPDQTVNTATGEMGFNLPLGSVKGIKGMDFPIDINYSAGISAQQEASPVGLGFSFGPGCIQRKVVSVPDDNLGGSGSFAMSLNETPNCDIPWWYYVFQVVVFIVGIILSIVAVYFPPVGIVAGILFTVAVSITSAVVFKPQDFIAGGAHLRAYEPLGGADHGKGFLREGAEHRDWPDMYFVNTPFVSGELVWCGDYNVKNGGYFVFKNTQGSSEKDNRTIKVEYSLDQEKFIITLADGTRLFFDETISSNNFSQTYWQVWQDAQHNVPCKLANYRKQIQRVPDQWLLTKVLYPDFIDGDGDVNPRTNPQLDKGSWLVFEYDHPVINNRRPLPTTVHAAPNVSVMCIPGSDPVLPNTSVYEEANLKWVRTPNQSAEYFYTANRKDNLWFDIDKMDWFAPARNQDPAEKRAKCKTAGVDPYIHRKVLDSVLIYSTENDTLRRILFNTSYKLKPGSFHSYSKDVNGEFVPIAGNPQAACLTLESINIHDNRKTKNYKISFNYNDSDLRVWNPDQIGSFHGPDPMRYYIEHKDYWGSFLLNTTNSNDFNQGGQPKKNPMYAAMWSMNQIEFSTGLKVGWEYDLNRYDAANNLPKSVKFGGGIRVHTMKVDDGIGKTLNRCYFYTDQAGSFMETDGNSSGHATVEPYPYLAAADQDLRTPRARGGYYTACKVSYEMVQVVDNYQSGGPYPAPNGYTVYEYTTPADQSATETFINQGTWGEIDNSWKRGFLKRKRVFNKSNAMIADEVHEYEFVEQNKVDNSVLNVLDSMSSYLYEHRFGWVKPKSNKASSLNVTSTTYPKFATDLAGTPPVDNLSILRNELKIFDAGSALKQHYNTDVSCSRTLTCRTRNLPGNSDANKYDYILGTTYYSGAFYFCAGMDLSDDVNDPNRKGVWTEWEQIALPGSNNHLVGMALMNVGGGPGEDLIIISSWHDWQYYLHVTILHDVHIVGSGSYRTLEWTDPPLYTVIKVTNTTDYNYLSSPANGSYTYPDGCIVKDVFGTSAPDIFVVTSVNECDHFPGDVGKTWSGENPPHGRHIIAFKDFQEPATPVPGGMNEITNLQMYKVVAPQMFFGNLGFFANADGGASENDLIIGGPGCISTDYQPGYETRYVSNQVFNNIAFDDVNRNITFDNYCSNCANDGNVLFNAKPIIPSSWLTLKCAGFFQEGQSKRFILYGKLNGALPTFQFVDYKPVQYLADYDGQPNRSYTQNSDNSFLLSTFKPAYSIIDAMGRPGTANNKHMLIQQSGSTAYHFPPSATTADLVGDLSVHADKVVGSKATTWDQYNGVFLPKANYAWKVKMNSTGLPLTNHSDFVYSAGAPNPDWRLTDSVAKFTDNSQVKEAVKPISKTKRLFASTIYGNRKLLPIASVSNAQFEECGVFTCDYNDEAGGYFDWNNAWEIGNACDPNNPLPSFSVTLNKSTTHFGNASVRVINAYGPSRNFRLTMGRDYIMSAWVNVVSGTAYMAGDFRYLIKTADVNNWPPSGLIEDPNVGFTGKTQGPTNGAWVLMKMKIPAASELAFKDWTNYNFYARMFIGSVLGGEVYMDDIRFYPENAMANSTYFDSLWQQPVIVVDANQQPGQRITYDMFARPVKWEKINPSKTFGTTGYAQLMKEKKYFMLKEGLILKTPLKGDVYPIESSMKITWINETGRKVKVFVSDITDPNGATWVLLQTVDPIANVKEYTYTWASIPASLPDGDNYRIKVEDYYNPEVFDKSERFAIKNAAIIYPTNGAILETGTAEEIRYYIYGASTIDVTISVNGTVLATVPNSGAYTWHVPADFTPSNNVRIQISGGGYSGESYPFTVKKRGFIRRTVFDFINRMW